MSTELISINPATNTVINRFKTHSDQELNLFATEAHKMIISEKKTKAMIINFTDKFQFTTRLQLKDNNV